MRRKPTAPPRKSPPPEIVVVGAGVVGAACASALARAGHRVRVLSHPARSTTAVSGGHLLLQSKHPGPTLDLARRSLELLKEFVVGREEELGYRQNGSLILAASGDEEALLRAHFERVSAGGIHLQWLTGDQARELEPALSPAIRAASFCPLDAQVQPGALAAAWLQDALAHRASVTSGALVESFVTSAGAVTGVVAGGIEYPANAVVLAAGVWSGELARMAGADIEIIPRRGILLRGTADKAITSRPLLGAGYLAAKFGDAPCAIAFSLQQHPDNQCVLGGSRETVGFSTADTEPAARRIRECAGHYVPALAQVDWATTTVGFRPWTPEREPRIGPSGVPGLYLACGHEGDGITLAAGTAERLVASITA